MACAIIYKNRVRVWDMPDLMDNERIELHGMLAEFRQALEEEIHMILGWMCQSTAMST